MVLLVPSSIHCHLGLPERGVRGRDPSLLAAVAVPEAAFDEYCRCVLWQNDVWSSREVSPVEPESKPESM